MSSFGDVVDYLRQRRLHDGVSQEQLSGLCRRSVLKGQLFLTCDLAPVPCPDEQIPSCVDVDITVG